MTKKLFSMAMLAMLATSFVACDKGNDDDESQSYKGTTGGHEWVDLGLTSGNLWATCNVGATNPWDYGNYYAWGETETKDNYSWETYKYGNDYNSLTKYNNNESSGTVDNKTTLELTDDVAAAVFGADFSMPTIADWEELRNQCYWVWTINYNEQNVSGYIVYRAKSNSDKGVKVCIDALASYSLSDIHIFLPAAGCRYGSNLYSAGDYGYYWSGSLYENYPINAGNCFFNSYYAYPSYDYVRCYGFSVRPVKRP